MTTPLFAQSRVPCLTREEECLLKTALAVVVIRKRKLQEQQLLEHSNDDDNYDYDQQLHGWTRRGIISRRQRSSNEHHRLLLGINKNDEEDGNGDPSSLSKKSPTSSLSFLLDSVMQTGLAKTSPGGGCGRVATTPLSSSSLSRLPLLKTVNHVHIDQMFQVAQSMIVLTTTTVTAASSTTKAVVNGRRPQKINPKNSNKNGDGTQSNAVALKGTASHLAQQLQVWLKQQHLNRTGKKQKESSSSHPPPQKESSSSSSSSSSSPPLLPPPPPPTTTTTTTLPQNWIRSKLSSIMSSSPVSSTSTTAMALLNDNMDKNNYNESTIKTNYAIFHAIIHQATNVRLVSTILSVVATMLRELYYDQFVMTVVVEKTTTTTTETISKNKIVTPPPPPPPPSSSKRIVTSSLADLLATLSLRLLKTCLGWYEQYHPSMGGGIEILHQCLVGCSDAVATRATATAGEQHYNNNRNDELRQQSMMTTAAATTTSTQDVDLLIPLTFSKLLRTYHHQFSCISRLLRHQGRVGRKSMMIGKLSQSSSSSSAASSSQGVGGFSTTTTNNNNNNNNSNSNNATGLSIRLDAASKLLLRHTLYQYIVMGTTHQQQN